MWRFLICVAALAGCSDDDGECRQADVVFRGDSLLPPSSAPPGTLYSVTRLKTPYPKVAALADGIACATCDGFALLDRSLDLTTGGNAMAKGLAASDDTIYTVQPIDGALRNNEVVAYTRAGELRWRAQLGDISTRLAATDDGVFLPTDHGLMFLAATDGRVQPLAVRDVIAFGAGGIFTATPGDGALTLQRTDRAGTAQWTRTWTGTIRPDVIASAAADGSLLVRVIGPETLDLGDRVLTATRDVPYFLISLAPDGATRWAFELNATGTPQLEPLPLYLTLLPNGDAMLAMDDGGLGPTDGYLAYANAAGIRRVYPLTGVGDQRIASLAVSPDGLVWFEATNYPTERHPGHELSFAGREYSDTGDYIFALVP